MVISVSLGNLRRPCFGCTVSLLAAQNSIGFMSIIGVVVGLRYSKENCEADVAEETESVRDTLSDSVRSRVLLGVEDSIVELVESSRDTDSRNECCMSDFVNLRCFLSSLQHSQQLSQHVNANTLSNNFLAAFYKRKNKQHCSIY